MIDDPRKEKLAQVFSDHLEVDDLNAAALARWMLDGIATAPMTQGQIFDDVREAIVRYMEAVSNVRNCFEALPVQLRQVVAADARFHITSQRHFRGSEEESYQAIENCFRSLSFSTYHIAAFRDAKSVGRRNWAAIATVKMCRNLWREHKRTEPPRWVQDKKDSASVNPFVAFLTAALGAAKINVRADAAMRAWNKELNISGSK